MIGELTNVSVAGMLRLLSVYQQTGCLKVTGDDGAGEIYLEQGRIVGTGSKKKELAEEVLRLLLVQQGFFHFEPLEAVPRAHQQGSLDAVESLIIESARRCAPAVAQEYLPAPDSVLQLAPIFSQRDHLQLNLTRDEWNFLTQVNGEDSLQTLLDKSKLPHEQAVRTAYGLLSAGLLRRTRFRIPEIMDIATQELGDLGEALVRQSFRKLGLDQSRMHMKELIALLNELERNITLLLGPTRASALIGRMWEGAKR